MKLLLLFTGILLLAAYGDYGNANLAIYGTICLMCCLIMASWNPDEGIEDEASMQDSSITETEF